ncbi:MAG: hypothetical protein HGB18_01750 [Candidatus Moranbacteria bacterium]|nr:hypothetical protein [Candidatus Moranbacteria bacterium]
MPKPTKNSRFSVSLAVATIIITLSLTSVARAAVKDADIDGLTDDGEISIYHTDPANADTDGDGISDGQEVTDGTDPLSADVRTVSASDFSDPGISGQPEKYPWYFGRAAGVAAFGLLTLSVVFGLIISSRAFTRLIPGVDAYELHRSISLAGLVAVVLHFVSLMFDGFLRLTPVEALVPFLFSREGLVSSAGFDVRIPVALGVIAFYLVVALILTAEFRSKLPARSWRIVHYASFAAYPLFVLHGFMSGTDSVHGWARVMYAGSVALVATLVVVRIISRTILFLRRRAASKGIPPVA